MSDNATQLTAVVTGSGSGIGQGTARALADAGYRLALVGRTLDKLEATARLIGREDTLVVECDVADRSSVANLVARVDQAFGRSVDVLVCNAGTNVKDRRIDVLDPADWDRMIATNLTGAFNLVHAFLPGMRARRSGLIVQVCSIAGLRASVLAGAGYAASKFGQGGLGLGVGLEAGKDGVRSSVIYPGEVNTPILANRPVPVPQERKDAMLQPNDVAAAVRFLAELHPRAHVPTMVIKPTVDEWG